MSSVGMSYGSPSFAGTPTEENRLYPSVMQMNLGECHDALYDFRKTARVPFVTSLRVAAGKVCELVGSLLIEISTLRYLTDNISRTRVIDSYFKVIDTIWIIICNVGDGLFVRRFRRRGAALCDSLRKLLWQAHEEWCWKGYSVN